MAARYYSPKLFRASGGAARRGVRLRRGRSPRRHPPNGGLQITNPALTVHLAAGATYLSDAGALYTFAAQVSRRRRPRCLL